MSKLTEALAETGEWEKGEDFLLCGNSGNPKLVAIFEKTWVFEAAIEALKTQIPSLLPVWKLTENLFVCTRGIPSSACLKFLKTLKAKRLIYFGDLDPTSFYTFLVLSYAKRIPKPKDKPKLEVKYGGITLRDCQKYLSSWIKIPDYEWVILSWVERFKIPELRKEIEFLKKNGRKIEMEGICRCFKMVRDKEGIYFKVSRSKMREFESYLKSKLKM